MNAYGVPRFDRLPKWAQEELLQLERRLADAESELRCAHAVDDGGEPVTNVQRLDLMEVHPLQNNAQIRFLLGGKRGWITVNHDRDSNHGRTLNVYADRRLIVLPHASNRIELSIPE